MAHVMTQNLYNALAQLKLNPDAWGRIHWVTKQGIRARRWAEIIHERRAEVTASGLSTMTEFEAIVRKPKGRAKPIEAHPMEIA